MAAINVLKKVTPYLDDVAGAVVNYGDDAARLARNNGDDLAKLHRRLSQYDAATSRITPELLAAHPELGSKFANLTRRLGNEASLKMPITAQTGVNIDASVPSNALRSGLGGTLAGIFDDVSTVVKNPNLFKDGNDAADYIYDRNLPNLKNMELLDSKRNANSGYVPTDALQGIESLTPPETLAEFFNRAMDNVDDFLPAFEDPSLSFGDILPYTRQYAPDYWQDVAYMSGTTINPKNSTINVRGKDIHYPMTDDAAGKTKLDKLWNVLRPDEERLMGPNFGPEYSVESVARGENVPGFPALTRAVRDFEDFGLDDVFGGDVGAATDAYENYRNRLQQRLNLAASIPKGYVPIDTLHDTNFRPHLNTAEYRHSPLSQMFTKFGKPRYPNFDPELPF